VTIPEVRAPATAQVLLAVLGMLLVGAGVGVVVSADDGLVRDRLEVDGVPVTLLQPASEGPFPGLVVAHGFAASSTLMEGIGIAAARDGWAVALLDFSGHGANQAPLGDEQDTLVDDLEAVRTWLAERTEGEPALLGHSMGAGVVTRVAAEDPSVPATVALSLPSADDLPPAADGPRSLLLLAGALEPSRFGATLAAADDLGYTTGTIPAAEHISILFRAPTLEQSVGWLDAALGREPAGPAAGDWRMPAVGVVYLGSALLFWPLSGWLVTSRTERVRLPRRVLPVWVAGPVAGVAAGGVLAVVPALGEVVPLVIGGYLAAFLAVAGLLLWAAARAVERPSLDAVGSGLVLGLYAAVALALPAQLAWAQVSLTGVRGLSALGLVLAAFLYAWGESLVAWRHIGYGRIVASRLLLAGVLLGLAVTGVAPGFLLLLAPLMVVVLPWFGAYGVRVARLSGSPLAAALTQALPLGVLVAITTPLA
jgi:dienelactone hydrolase